MIEASLLLSAKSNSPWGPFILLRDICSITKSLGQNTRNPPGAPTLSPLLEPLKMQNNKDLVEQTNTKSNTELLYVYSIDCQ